MVNKRWMCGEEMYFRSVRPENSIKITDMVKPTKEGLNGNGVYATTSLQDAVLEWGRVKFGDNSEDGTIMLLKPKGKWYKPRYTGNITPKYSKKAHHLEKTVRVYKDNDSSLPDVEGIVNYRILINCNDGDDSFEVEQKSQKVDGRQIEIYDITLKSSDANYSTVLEKDMAHYISSYLHNDRKFNEMCSNNSIWSYTPKEEELKANVMFG